MQNIAKMIQNAAKLLLQAGAIAQELCQAQAHVARVRTSTVLCCSMSPSPSDGSAWSHKSVLVCSLASSRK